MKLWLKTLVLISGATGALIACGNSKPADGREGGACYPNFTCEDGFICRSNLCVDPNSTGAKGDGDGDSTSGVDVDACFGCGADSCKAEADACDAANGCSDVMKCWVECAGDQSCADACDASNVSSADIDKISAYFGCIATECLNECAAQSTGGGDGDGDGDGDGGTCTSEGKEEGSCTTDNETRTCVDGRWEVSSCAGCSVVSPSKTCDRITAFALRELPNHNFEPATATDVKLTQTSTSVSAQWYLEASLAGMLEFRFDAPIDPFFVRITGDTSNVEFVTLELPDGDGGCTYELEGGELYRAGSYDEYGDIAYNGCWGTLANNESYDYYEPTNLTSIKLRTATATSNELTSVTITQILL